MFNKKVKRIVAFILVGFIILFLLRFSYDLFKSTSNSNLELLGSNYQNAGNNLVFADATSSGFSAVKNYATYNYSKDSSVEAQQTSQVIEQKYEKTATLSSESGNFESDQKEIDNAVKKYSALIQYNQFSGLTGNRLLQIAIGVDPEKFDNMVASLKKIGKLQAINISKFDKTGEYKDIQAKKKLLEDTRKEFIALKSKAQKVDESINVQNKITEIDNQIQQLGLSLDEYNSNISLCTVKFSMQEKTTIKADSGIKPREIFNNIFEAFEWSILYYSLVLLIILLALIIAFCLLKVVEKFLVVKLKMDNINGTFDNKKADI